MVGSLASLGERRDIWIGLIVGSPSATVRSRLILVYSMCGDGCDEVYKASVVG